MYLDPNSPPAFGVVLAWILSYQEAIIYMSYIPSNLVGELDDLAQPFTCLHARVHAILEPSCTKFREFHEFSC